MEQFCTVYRGARVPLVGQYVFLSQIPTCNTIYSHVTGYLLRVSIVVCSGIPVLYCT